MAYFLRPPKKDGMLIGQLTREGITISSSVLDHEGQRLVQTTRHVILYSNIFETERLYPPLRISRATRMDLT